MYLEELKEFYVSKVARFLEFFLLIFVSFGESWPTLVFSLYFRHRYRLCEFSYGDL